ncbi:MAG: UvrD-helicase domain-containing protein [Victivallales bacterium]|jgi:exodeoxyribonuclease V beta subunit
MTAGTKEKPRTSAQKAKNEFDILRQPIDSGYCFLIEASAGTGKTYNIQHLYLRLILERGLEVGAILAVTYTDAATAELRTRIRGNLQAASEVLAGNDIGDDDLQTCINSMLDQARKLKVDENELKRRLRLALLSFDEAAIFTIHGFCSRMLNENAFESRVAFDLELVEDQDEILNEILADFWRRNFYGKNEVFTTALEFCEFGPANLLEFAKLVVSKPELILLENEAFGVSDAELTTRIRKIAEKVKSVRTNAATNPGNLLLMQQLSVIDSKDIDDNETAIRVLNLLERNTIAGVKREIDPFNSAVKISIKKAMYAHLRNERPLEARKRIMRLQSYDDMLFDLRTALRDKSGRTAPECDLAKRLRARYKAAMIDEFQDTDPVQCEIFNTVFRHVDSLFVMIGDPKQSIYKFRTADVYAYLDAKNREDTESRTLTRNFRSAQALLDGVNELFSGNMPFLEEGIPYIGVESGRSMKRKLLLPPEAEGKPFHIDWIKTPDESGIAKSNVNVIEYTADQIVEALQKYRWESCYKDKNGSKSESLMPRDIAILVPKHKHARAMRSALKRRGITSIISNSGNVFESEMAKEVFLLLRAVQNPGNTKYLKTALGGGLFCFPEETLIGLADSEDSSGKSSDRLSFWADIFKEYRVEWEKKGVMPMLSSLVMRENLHPNRVEEKAIDRNDKDPFKKGIDNLANNCKLSEDGLDMRERNIVDIRHLMELLHRTERDLSLSPQLLLTWLQQMINGTSMREVDPDAFQTRLETDLEAVTIMTIHKSKGLQFPLVFCPMLWDSSFNLKAAGKPEDWFCHDTTDNSLILPLGNEKDSYKHQGEKEELGELLRVAYVASTRAEYFCRLLFGNFKKDCTKTALNYLFKRDIRNDTFLEQNAGSVGNTPATFENILVSTVDADNVRYQQKPPKYEMPDAHAIKLKNYGLRNGFEVPKNWGIMSYTSLGQHKTSPAAIIKTGGGKDEAGPGSMTLEDLDKEITEGPRLPGGEKTGSCFHEIMENLDFKLVQGNDHGKWSEIPLVRELIESKMRKFGLIRGKRAITEIADPLLVERYPLLCKLIHKTLTARIPGPCGCNSFSLNEIEKPDHISEMDFFYEITGNIDKARLKEIAKTTLPKIGLNGENEILSSSLDLALSGGRVNTGFMNGSIDLVFRRDGRYCFADWKTNTLDDYGAASLWRKMFSDSFILQYLIYSLTLDLYLKRRLKNYDFEKHFGGGYYIFVRGLESDNGKGILADRIDGGLLDRLKKCIHHSTIKTHEVI